MSNRTRLSQVRPEGTAGQYPKVNATEDGWDYDTPSGAGSNIKFAKATRQSSGQSIPNNADTAIAWDTEVYDTDSMVNVGGANPSRVVINTAGKVSIKAGLSIGSNSSNTRVLKIRKNGTTILANQNCQINGGYAENTIDTDDAAIVGDYYEAIVYQDSGGALSTVAKVAVFISVTVFA